MAAIALPAPIPTRLPRSAVERYCVVSVLWRSGACPHGKRERERVSAIERDREREREREW